VRGLFVSCAGPRGFEPRSTVLETAILPLNYRPLLASIPFLQGFDK
jgi:hypothetical protein